MLAVAGVWLTINLLLVGHHVGDVLENASFGVGAVVLLLLVLSASLLSASLVPRVGAHLEGGFSELREYRILRSMAFAQEVFPVRSITEEAGGRYCQTTIGERKNSELEFTSRPIIAAAYRLADYVRFPTWRVR